MSIAANSSPKRAPRLQADSHLFALGQAVRLKGGLQPSGNVYLVTAQLPPVGDSPQYHIRNEAEKFERMASQVNLEPALPSTSGGGAAALIEKSFSNGHG